MRYLFVLIPNLCPLPYFKVAVNNISFTSGFFPGRGKEKRRMWYTKRSRPSQISLTWSKFYPANKPNMTGPPLWKKAAEESTPPYWSFQKRGIWAHMEEITGNLQLHTGIFAFHRSYKSSESKESKTGIACLRVILESCCTCSLIRVLLASWILNHCQAPDRTPFGVSKPKRRLHRIVWVLSKCNIVGNYMPQLICSQTAVCGSAVAQW